ncbi:hypothetical protein [Luteimonas salinilitoris]|uniref:Uncharacterized protein n=1 Tax=Luteimonas salinilitoris TaxID=3237697 RepID=A0ABV4HWP3_9GAMM
MEHVWIWREFDSWAGHFWETLSDVLTSSVLRAFDNEPPEYVVGDDLGWLDEIVAAQTGALISTKHLLADRIEKYYGAIRAFHGARPIDPTNYRVQGLKVLDGPSKIAYLQQLFEGAGQSVSDEVLLRAVERVGTDYRAGRVYFEANSRFLQRHCGHYMLYGSEYLNAIAAHISERHRAVLRQVGTPTVFVCNVPLSTLCHGQIVDYAGMALQALFVSRQLDHFEHAGEHEASGLMIQQDLPADCIIDHFHPTRLYDPYRQVWERCNFAV